MPIVEVFVLICAVFGASFLVFFTDGPWEIFFHFRTLLIRVDGIVPKRVHITEEEQEEGFFGKLFSCFWCTTTWVALIIIGSYYLLNSYPLKTFPYVLLAVIGVSGYLYERLGSG